MPRAVDHLVLPVTTLALARSRLASLGFTVAPDARHPFGTGNCCVFFGNRTYLEPIAILDRAAADMAAAEGAYFVKRLKRFSERHGEGFAMLALKSDDAERDQAKFARAGFGAGPIFRFSRMATLPDGAEAEIGVMLAFGEHPDAPDATIFACQQLAEDALYPPAYLEHPNGAVGVGGVVAVAEAPESFGGLLAAVTGSELNGDASGLEARLGDHSLSILTPAAYRARFGLDSPDPRRGLLFAACDMIVADLDRAIGYAGPAAKRHGNRIVIPPGLGLGTTLAFTAASDD